jgi:N-acetylmuramic acid 6-phosphate etherase
MAERSTEARHPASAGIHAVGGAEVLSRILNAQGAAVQAVQPALSVIEVVAEAAARALRTGGKMAYVGAGSSGLMALSDCLELAGTFGIMPDRTPMLFAGGAAALLHMTGAVEDDLSLAQADFDAAGLKAGDVAICISASGSTAYTLEVARLAKAAGVTIAGIANVAGSALLTVADLPVLLNTGPEVISGSTRMAAATAQKVALNMISVLVGIRLGHVHNGYMVNVVADNAKLRERAAGIVASVSGADLAASRAALEATAGAVKPAILVAQGRSVDCVTEDLTKSQGHLTPWLE